jgi:hypothetical protein
MVETEIYTTDDGFVAIEQPNDTIVLLSAKTSLSPSIKELQACYDNRAEWRTAAEVSSRVAELSRVVALRRRGRIGRLKLPRLALRGVETTSLGYNETITSVWFALVGEPQRARDVELRKQPTRARHGPTFPSVGRERRRSAAVIAANRLLEVSGRA